MLYKIRKLKSSWSVLFLLFLFIFDPIKKLDVHAKDGYRDGRPEAKLRLEAKDHGIVLRHGDGPDSCDIYGARDIWVFEDNGKYYMHYDAAGPKGWLCALATSNDLIHWDKKGPVLDLGKPGSEDSKSASYGTVFFDGKEWHVFYLGTLNTTKPPDRIPAFPYLTMKAKAKFPTGPWTKQYDVVPFRTQPNTYYTVTASPGFIVKHQGEYLHFFSAAVRNEGIIKRTIGLARTKDLNSEWQIGPQPIVPLEEQIENSSIYYEESIKTWFLFTNHIGIEEREFTDAIWVYWSKDLNKWDTKNKAIVLDNKNCTWSKRVIGLPSVLRIGEKLAIFYDGLQEEGIGHMRRDVGLAWLDLPLKLPGTISPDYLRCEYRENPLGIDEIEPRLSWIVESSQRSQKQSAYQILVANTPELLQADTGDLWDSGIVKSNKTAHIPYAGKQLQSRMSCYWKVRVWDQEGRVSAWSDPALWTMGLLKPEDWQGKWIGGEFDASTPMSKDEIAKKWQSIRNNIKSGLNMADDDQYPPEHKAIYLRKNVRLEKKPIRITAYICGLGHYELYINGKKVGDHLLDPGYTNYNKRLLYVTYDATDYFKQGSNAIGVILGNGRYYMTIPDEWNFEQAPWIDKPKLLLNIKIEYSDGTSQNIVTDETWKWSTGPIVYNYLYGGETYDARKENHGWDRPDYNDSDWKPVKIVTAPSGRLSAQQHPPIRIMQTIRPVNLTEPNPGIYVFDLGVNIAGWVQFKTSGKSGQKITLEFNEMLNPDGTVNMVHCSHYIPGRFQTGELILKGEGTEVYEPRFTYHAFRYVQITGLTKKPTLDDLTACWIHTDVVQVGEFSCSNEKLNKLQDAAVRSHSNAVHHYLADCIREKLGWTQDAQNCMEMGIFNNDMATVYRKWFYDIIDAQEANGHVQPICPTGGWGNLKPDGSIGFCSDPWWGGVIVMIPWTWYQYFGDPSLLEEGYESMKKWVDFLGTTADDHILSWLLGDWDEVGRHGQPTRTPIPQTSTCGYFYCADILSRTASLLGKHNDAKKYNQLAQKINTSFNTKFYDAKTGLYAEDSQAAQAVPLHLNMVPDSEKERVLNRLIENIEERNNHLSTGFVATLPLLHVLTNTGHADLAYTIVTQEDYPGWWHMIKDGSTTLWEDWEGPESPSSIISRNMASLGGPLGLWFYQALGGIRPDPTGPGFKKIIIKPEIVGDLTFVKASYKSIHGTISTFWQIDGDVFKLDVTIPANTTATAYLPTRDVNSVSENNCPVMKTEAVKFLRMEGDKSVYSIESGTYYFMSKLIR